MNKSILKLLSVNYKWKIMKYLLLTCFAFLVFVSANSQPSVNAKQRLQEEKREFLTSHIGLTKSEASAFWPVYDDYQNRKNRIVAEKKTLMRYYLENKSNMKDQEITDTLEKYLALEKQETELFITYNAKFRNILADEKVLRIYVAEVQFKDYLLKQLRTD